MKELLIVSTGRSGTNYFCAALRNFDRLMVAYEVFNPRAVFGIEPALDRLRDLRGVEFTDFADPRLVAFFRHSPGEALDAVATIARERNKLCLAVKLIAAQLDASRLEPVLARPGLEVVFVARRRLDVYASQLKALHLKRWQLVRSDAVTVEFALGKFVSWSRRMDAALGDIRDRLPDGSYRTITYEDVVDTDLLELVRRQQRLLREIGVSVDVPERLRSGDRFCKQDRGSDSFAKFIEPLRVQAELEAAGLRDYALGAFLSGEIETLSHARRR